MRRQRSEDEAIELIVRRPDFDFREADPIWTPAHLDFGYSFNGGSLILPYLEPYLIRVMRQAKTELEERAHPRAAALSRDIDLFNGQEANHYRIHAAYNAMLRERYEGLEVFEAEIEADFARMLREESLEWNVGYSAGFETTGMVMAQLFFEGPRASFENVDRPTADLWGWHLAEEYEHRCVAFDVYQALYGGWRQRVKMFLYQQRHLMNLGTRAAEHMRRQDEAAGRISRSARRDPKMWWLDRRRDLFGLRHVAAALLPWHDPHTHAALPDADGLLSRVV